MISIGIIGAARHVVTPNSDSMMRVNTLELMAPPRRSISSRAFFICGASTDSPIVFSAKYAFTLALMSNSWP